jgi:hypothetical protein
MLLELEQWTDWKQRLGQEKVSRQKRDPSGKKRWSLSFAGHQVHSHTSVRPADSSTCPHYYSQNLTHFFSFYSFSRLK